MRTADCRALLIKSSEAGRRRRFGDVAPVVQTVEDAAVARRVARLWPVLTIKG